MHRSHVLLGVSAITMLTSVVPTSAFAQAATDADEIIVTARKRQESILQVPVVETVITQRQLERGQVSNLNDLAALTTGVQLGGTVLENGTQVSIRGVGTSSLDPGVDQSVSLNLDGLQLSQGNAYRSAVFDMQQVEVLKGPQALFFGKNSPGGVISIRTADPGDKFEMIGRIGHEFVANEWRGEAIVSGPVTDTLGLRLSTLYSDYGGFFRNVGQAIPATGAVQPNYRPGESTSLFLRGTAVFKPTSNFSARLKLNYTRDRAKGGTPQQLVSCPDGTVNYTGIPFFAPAEDCKRDRNISIVDLNPAAFPGVTNNGRQFTNMDQKFGTLELNYKPSNGLTLTSVTGYYKVRVNAMINGYYSGAAAPTLAAVKDFGRREVTQELRVNSDWSGPLNLTGGGFYQDGRMTNGIVLPGNTFLGLPALLTAGTHEIRIKSYSVFGQGRYKVARDFEIAAGVRWTNEKKSDNPTTVVGPTTVFPIEPRLHSKNWSPELTLTYTPTTDLTIFGSLKQGYKSGSYNLTTPVQPGQNNSYGDEKVQGGEVGLKSRLADRQLTLNLAGYYYKYKGLQVGGYEGSIGNLPNLRTLNAGAARVYGVDFDVSYRPAELPELNLRAAVNWNHARFTSFPNAPCSGGQTIAEGCNRILDPSTGLFKAQDLAGSPLVRAPMWQATIGGSYDVPLNETLGLEFAADGQYTSKYLTILGNRPDFYQRGYAKINATITLKPKDERWEFALIGNNLSNKLTAGNCVNLAYAGELLPGTVTGGTTRGPAGQDEVICSVERGRELWVRLTLRPSEWFR